MTAFNRHGEWLSLIDVSGPFLAEPVLKQVFPQGLEQIDLSTRKYARQAYDEWREAVDIDDPDCAAIHGAWIDLVLKRVLELDEHGEEDVLKPGSVLPESLAVAVSEHDVTLRPDYAVFDADGGGRPLMFAAIYPPDMDLRGPVKADRWTASPAERMVELCRARDVRLGLVTNGERWMLVDAPVGGVTSFASWYARLWGQEPVTLQAFVNLLGIRRFFVDDSERLPALLDESLKLQDEVTEALGEQVRRAVEVLVQALDRADVDRNRELLAGVEPPELYEASLTVMMRIVFILAAEERGLLLDEESYQTFYAVSTLRMQLGAEPEEILERRQDAWSRLLAIFRAVYGGIEHEALKLPALGGSLFDPDRFTLLEGRAKGTCWREHPATPLPIDNRTVLLLLDAVQLFEGRTLSYRALDIEQIGYVYEGLLERTVVRAREVTLDLDATKSAKIPWVTLDELESVAAGRDGAVQSLLRDRTGSSAGRVKNDLAKEMDDAAADRLLTACNGNRSLRERITPYFHFLRVDRWGYPLVYPVGTFMVMAGSDRRETGTHYTPKSLTETIVKETMEPLVYDGPAEGKPRENWILRWPSRLLDLKICDPAMGSGALLVQACRWLSERLVEAWGEAEITGRAITAEGEVVDDIGELEPLRGDAEDRVLTARRLIAERCLYGVDMNPLAVELAKLSIWLITLAKGRPFGFLDHNLRCGDSLLGIHNLDQLLYLDMNYGTGSSKRLFAANIGAALDRALQLRAESRNRPIRDICDVRFMATLDACARQELEIPQLIANALVDETLLSNGKAIDIAALSIEAGGALQGVVPHIKALTHRTSDALSNRLRINSRTRHPFHWPLEFPEVFDRENPGFDALIGNPPFLGNRLWKSMIHQSMQWQAQMILGRSPGKIDLSVVFHRRAAELLRNNGVYGLLATTNIAEGSSISLGLGEVVKQGEILFAIKSFRWPGKASVTASVICFYKGHYKGFKYADGVECRRIGARLGPEIATSLNPLPVPCPLFGFVGIDNSRGLAFVVGPGNLWLEELRSEHHSLLRPYVTGNDITHHALQNVQRWALDLEDRSLDDIAARWPIAHDFLMEVVKPTRTEESLKSYKGLHDRWWQFWNHRVDLVQRLRRNGECIVFSKVTKHPICMLADSSWIYTNQVAVISYERPDTFAICLSSLFTEWIVARQGAKFGVGATLRLSIREAFHTYPLPDECVKEDGILAANEFSVHAKGWCLRASKGLTGFANALGDPSNVNPDIVSARRLLNDVDRAVAEIYGLDDIWESRSFRQAPYVAAPDSLAYIVAPKVRERTLERLVLLNKRQCTREVLRT